MASDDINKQNVPPKPPSQTNLQAKSKTNLPSKSKTELPSKSKTNLQPSTSKSPKTSSSKSNLPLTGKANVQSKSKTLLPTAAKTVPSTKSKPNLESKSKTNLATKSKTNVSSKSKTNLQTPPKSPSLTSVQKSQAPPVAFKRRFLGLDTPPAAHGLPINNSSRKMNDTKEKMDPKQEEYKNNFATFLWNPWKKEFCGRTASSWGKIFVFYVIFYLCLAAFWAAMLLIFRTTIDDKEPKWKLEESRIGVNPGLGYRPRPPRERIESTLIRFRRNNKKTFQHWVDDLTTFVDGYTGVDNKSLSGGAAQPVDCEQNTVSSENQFCYFDVRRIGRECSAENQFGYADGKPCVLIKLNRIFDWKPETYGPEDSNDASLPQELRNAIGKASRGSKNNRLIYITCEGQNPIDKENIGPIEYYPDQGIAEYYFPFRNQDNYKSPFVFVRFANPNPGLIINVECKAWAKNIKHNLVEREGSVHFELSIE